MPYDVCDAYYPVRRACRGRILYETAVMSSRQGSAWISVKSVWARTTLSSRQTRGLKSAT